MSRHRSSSLLVQALAASRHSNRTPPKPAPRAQTPRRQETIEIRGQVPTPQVVTVRPREAPAYSRSVLVPAFFDHDFWPSILPPLQIVSRDPAAPGTDSTVHGHARLRVASSAGSTTAVGHASCSSAAVTLPRRSTQATRPAPCA